MEDCDISSQSDSCVVIRSADPSLRRCRIHDGKENGIFFSGNGTLGTLEDNDIFANALAGVDITRGHPTLRRNRITKNGDVGVKVWSRRSPVGGGIFEDNDLCGNVKGAWYIAPVCERQVQRRGNKE